MVVSKAHCFYCFDVLAAYHEGREPMEPEFDDDKYPLFVTWDTVKPPRVPRLRGCIGNFDPLPLHSGLREYALTSSLRDRRFSPITHSELPTLTVSVSLLLDFTPGDHHLDWEIGVHGIWIEFNGRTATYLPEVAKEQGWTKVEAIDSLLRKGGYSGKINDTVRKGIRLTRYRSVKKTVNYDEYMAYLEMTKPKRVDSGYAGEAEMVN